MGRGGRRRAANRGDIIALREHRALYFAIPKAANSSLKAACADLLRAQLGDRYRADLKHAPFRDPEARRALNDEGVLLWSIDTSQYGDYFKFTFVRNPFDRLVSCFVNKLREPGRDSKNYRDGVHLALTRYGCFRAGMSFHEFALAIVDIPDDQADRHFESQHRFVTDDEGTLLVDAVGRFERLAEDFDRFFAGRLGAQVELPHLLRSSRGPFEGYYDDDLRNRVRERYAEDFELFGYA